MSNNKVAAQINVLHPTLDFFLKLIISFGSFVKIGQFFRAIDKVDCLLWNYLMEWELMEGKDNVYNDYWIS